MSELLRIELTKAEVHRLRILAAEAGEDRAKFYRRALMTAPATRKAFQTKESK